MADQDILDAAGRAELESGMKTRLGAVLSEAIGVHSMIQIGLTVTPADLTDEGLVALEVLTEQINRAQSRRIAMQTQPGKPNHF